MSRVRGLTAVALALGLLSAPAGADEVEAALEAALEAYRAGDTEAAKQELDYASTLIAQMKAEGLMAFLPEPLEGWTRTDPDTGSAGMAMFGGGLSASAGYARGSETVEIQLMADNQMVAMMGAMLGNPQMMAQMGKVERINRQMVLVDAEGQVQALIDNRILVQISGSAPTGTKLEYFRRIDLDGLKSF